MLLVAGAIFTLGVYVVGRERANSVALSFVVLTCAISVWLTAIAFTLSAPAGATALAIARVAYVGVALIPAAVLQFSMTLLDVTAKNFWTLRITWVTGAVFVVLFTASNALLVGVWQFPWGYYPHLSAAAALFLVYFAVILASALYMLAKAEPRSERERRRNRAVFIALAVGYIGSVDYLPAFGIDLYPIGFAAILGFIVLIARSIFRYRFRDLSPSFVAERLLQTMHGGVIVVDTRGSVRVVNDVAAQLLGWKAEEIQRIDLRALLGVTMLPATDSESFCRNSITRDRLVRWRRRDGTHVELSLSASALRDDDGNALGVLYAISASEYKASHDFLTMLPNRERFADLFEEAKKRIAASGRTAAVLFIDLDGFKAVNDQHGHAAGDALLQMVSKRIRNSVRGDDIIARYAGDEFILRVDLARPDDAGFVASKLLRIISEPYLVEGKQITIGASIGASFYPRDGSTAEELLRVADNAMYGAKRDGKGRVRIAAPKTDNPLPPPYAVNATA